MQKLQTSFQTQYFVQTMYAAAGNFRNQENVRIWPFGTLSEMSIKRDLKRQQKRISLRVSVNVHIWNMCCQDDAMDIHTCPQRCSAPPRMPDSKSRRYIAPKKFSDRNELKLSNIALSLFSKLYPNSRKVLQRILELTALASPLKRLTAATSAAESKIFVLVRSSDSMIRATLYVRHINEFTNCSNMNLVGMKCPKKRWIKP